MERALFTKEYPTVHLFSRKEREVLVFTALGMNSKEISIQLNVLPKSIDNYKNRITKKLGVKGYGALGSFMVENRAALLELSILFPKAAENMSKPGEFLKGRNLPFNEMENISGGCNVIIQYHAR